MFRVSAHASWNGFWSNRFTFIAIANKVVVTTTGFSIRRKRNRNKSIPFVVNISALTVVLVDYRINIFLTNVAVGLRFSPLIPLLQR